MRVKTVIEEDFTNYQKPAMFIGTISCGGKCCVEMGFPLSVCQNDAWRTCSVICIDDQKLCSRYVSNQLTSALIFGGLEPFEQFEEMKTLIHILRIKFQCEDDIVIYTGYYPEEIAEQVKALSAYKNIIIKYGRYVPGKPSVFDEVLGITLSSDNQFAERIS